MRTFISSTLFITALLASVLPTAFARDCGGSCTASNASAVMSEGLGMVLTGSLSVVAASGQVTIEALEKTADGVVLVVSAAASAGASGVKAASAAGTASIKLSGKAIEKMAFVAGQTLEISAITTGYFLVYSGKAVAFIPNEVGQALLEHEKVKP